MNRSNLRHPTLLAKVKSAIIEATRKAAWSEPAIVDVMSTKGSMALRVAAWKGKGFEVYDLHDNDVTEAVKEALREYHATMPAGRVVLKNVRASFPQLMASAKPAFPALCNSYQMTWSDPQ